ncbi:MAG: hypothetical protein IH623_04550 [Verrucomicrobia bacterium]|nr:hypothetical protein [Verrucomicrobiota bacterium]
MLVHRFLLLCATQFVVCGFAFPSHGVEEGTATNSTMAKLEVEIRQEHGTGIAPARRAYLTAGATKFAFLVPAGLRVDLSNPERVVLTTADGYAHLTIRVNRSLPPGLTGLDSASVRQLVLSRHPGAQIKEEFSASAANQSGPAFDFRWNLGSLACASRVAFIPCVAGFLEFNLTGNADKLDQYLSDLSTVMQTFCASDANGQLEVTPLSDQI